MQHEAALQRLKVGKKSDDCDTGSKKWGLRDGEMIRFPIRCALMLLSKQEQNSN